MWIANPSSGRVAYIDAATLEIKLVDAGNGPTYVAAVPMPTDDVAHRPQRALARRHAAARLGVGAHGALDPRAVVGQRVGGLGRRSLGHRLDRRAPRQEPGSGRGLSGHHRPRSHHGRREGHGAHGRVSPGRRQLRRRVQRAFAVTQDGVSVVALDAAQGAGGDQEHQLTRDPPPAVAPDVAITPDGAYALAAARGDRASESSRSPTASASTSRCPGAVTDLDLSADGSSAVAVIRDTSQVALLPVPASSPTRDGLTLVTIDAIIGSTALAAAEPDGVLLHQRHAEPAPRGDGHARRAAGAARYPAARADPRRSSPRRTRSHALVLHDALSDAGSHYPAAFSVAPIALDLPPKIVGLDAPVISIAVAPGGRSRARSPPAIRRQASTSSSSPRMPSLNVQKLPLASLPIAAGIVAGANRGFVAQKHPDGRITFVNLKTRRGPDPDRLRARHPGRRRYANEQLHYASSAP